MKKTLVALATLAAVGVASAEVTLYGKLDVGLSSSKKDGEASQGVQFGSGNYEGSRVGLKGSSDIADGVKGIFQVEGGLGATDGSFSSFNREAFFGLVSSYGTVSVGRMWTPYDSAFNDALEYNGFSAMGKAFNSGIHGDNGMDGSGASKNAIQYSTPNFSGFTASVMYGSNADATRNAITGVETSATNYTGLGLNYASGPYGVSLATEKVTTKLQDASAAAGDYSNAWILSGYYDLGMAKLFAAVNGATADSGPKNAGFALGVSVPVSKAMTVGLGYATESTTKSGLSDGKVNSTGVQVVYAWNAATAIYGGYRSADTTKLGSTASASESKFATGVRYNF